MIEAIFIAIGLAMDAFAVSVSTGMSVRGFNWKKAIIIGLYFGFFQFIMPLIGYFLGQSIRLLIEEIGHFIAFGLLVFIGGKMIFESLKSGDKDPPNSCAFYSPSKLAFLAVATSIDALAAGISMAFTDISILSAAVIIGTITFVLSVIGGILGKSLNGLFRKGAETIGGLVLIIIGIKILIEHFN